MSVEIKSVKSDKEIAACFSVMAQLRPHLIRDEFVSRVRSQMQEGYRMACALDAGEVAAVAGYRIQHGLSWGKYLYVDDLVTDADRRSRGIGKALLQWLVQEARQHNCNEFHLDSGTQRKDAHRFYEREGMDMLAYHFRLSL
ncbi:MAG: GNAT family N-acetyltransferase [Gammaproteobacteria bacterium]